MKKLIALSAILLMCIACERDDIAQITDDNEKLSSKMADSTGVEIIDSVDPKDITPPRR